MRRTSSKTNLTFGKIDGYALAACSSTSFAKRISTPARATPKSKPPHPENNEIAVIVFAGIVLRDCGFLAQHLENRIVRELVFQAGILSTQQRNKPKTVN